MRAMTDESILILARHVVAAGLSEALADPRTPVSPTVRLIDTDGMRAGWVVMVEAYGGAPVNELGLGEIPPEVSQIEPLIHYLMQVSALRAEVYQHVFGLVIQRDCPPYETEYCHWADPTYRAQQMADVAGFYRAFGVEPNPSRPERHDHASLEIEFIAFLLQKSCLLARDDQADEGAILCRSAIRDFIRDHIVWWMPTFGRCVERRVEKLLSQVEERHGPQLHNLADVGKFLRAWTAAERIANSLDPSRQIIAPMVDPGACDSQDSDCDGCTSGGPE